MLLKLDKFLEYVPILLFALYFMSENDCKNHHINIMIRFIILTAMWLMFYILVHKLNVDKDTAFITTGALWIIMAYVRQNYLHFKST